MWIKFHGGISATATGTADYVNCKTFGPRYSNKISPVRGTGARCVDRGPEERRVARNGNSDPGRHNAIPVFVPALFVRAERGCLNRGFTLGAPVCPSVRPSAATAVVFASVDLFAQPSTECSASRGLRR